MRWRGSTAYTVPMPMDCWPTSWKSPDVRNSTGARSSMRDALSVPPSGMRISSRMAMPWRIANPSRRCATTSRIQTSRNEHHVVHKWHLRRAAACAAVALALPAALCSQELSAAVGHYHLDVWRSQDGARLAFVSNLIEARDGYLWLSSQWGLGRFGGGGFTVFDGS